MESGFFNHKTEKYDLLISTYTDYIETSNVRYDYDMSMTKCKEGCKNFGTKYSCPPSSPSFETYLPKYKYMIVNVLRTQMTGLPKKYNSLRMTHIVMKSLQRKAMDRLHRLVDQHLGLHLHLANGSCKGCKSCAINDCLPCRHPEKKRFSLESTGVDVNYLSKRLFTFPLVWYHKAKPGYGFSFPDYQCIASAILLNSEPTKEFLQLVNKEYTEGWIYESKK
jgi:predicted metal-binding protein